MPRRLYRYCGLRLDSEWPLPVAEDPEGGAGADLVIRVAPVPAGPKDARRRDPVHEIGADETLWRLEGVARYRVQDGGSRIDIDPDPDADPDAVTLMLLHPVFALACMRRGDWLLSASAVAVDGQAVAFAGLTGSGKSSLAALLARRGNPFVADGLLRIAADGPDGTMLAHPQAPWALLWPDMLERLDDPAQGAPVRAGLALRRVPFAADRAPLPLARVGFLVRTGKVDEGRTDMDLSASQGFARIRITTAGGDLIRSAGDRVAHLHWGAALSRACPLETLALPWGWDRCDAMLDAAEEWGRR